MEILIVGLPTNLIVGLPTNLIVGLTANFCCDVIIMKQGFFGCLWDSGAHIINYST